jgi:hypothetical protein
MEQCALYQALQPPLAPAAQLALIVCGSTALKGAATRVAGLQTGPAFLSISLSSPFHFHFRGV